MMRDHREEMEVQRPYLRNLFEEFDPKGDGTGSLSPSLMKTLLESVNVNLTLSDVCRLVQQIDLDGNGTIEWNEFQFFFKKAVDRSTLKKKAQKMVANDQMFIKDLCAEFDSTGQGCLSLKDLYALCKFLKMGLSRAEVQMLQATIDLDGNGFLEPEELVAFFDEVKTREELTIQMKRAAKGENTSQFLEAIFKKFDSRRSGHLRAEDLLAVTSFLKLDFTSNSIRNLLSSMDTDKNGTIELDEFMSFFSTVKQWGDLRTLLRDFHIMQRRMRRAFQVFFCASILGAILFTAASQTEQDTPFLTLGVACACISFLLGLFFVGCKRVAAMLKVFLFVCNWRKLVFSLGLTVVAVTVLVMVAILDFESQSALLPLIIASATLSVVLSIIVAAAMLKRYGYFGVQKTAVSEYEETSPRQTGGPPRTVKNNYMSAYAD